MITKYFSKVVVRFNPALESSKSSRIFLSSIPPQLKLQSPVDFKLLNAQSKDEPLIKVTFKDKKTLEINPSQKTFTEIGNYFDRHSKALQIQEIIQS